MPYLPVAVIILVLASLAAAQPTAPPTTGRADAAAADKLASLNRAVEPLADIDQIIQRYDRFAAANAGTSAAEEAKSQAAVWRDRKARGVTKLGSRWMTPSERDELMRSVHPKVESARQLISTGQQRDAEPILAEVLELDSGNISALYLQGLILFAQEKLPQARKSFEAVNAQIAGHAPTLNNLAVINFRQKQLGAAMNLYDQAMTAAPQDRTIVDNVAEALNTLKDDDRRMPVIGKVSRRFADQEAALMAALRGQDLYRWGASWVNKEQFDQLLAMEKEIEKKITQYKTDFELLSAQLSTLGRQIEDADREIKRIEADSYLMDSSGNWIRRQLPSYYYDEVRRRDRLISERAQAVAQQRALREQAERVKQDFPVPKFSGVQKLIGDEGTPLEAPTTESEAQAPPRPATQPATRPAP